MTGKNISLISLIFLTFLTFPSLAQGTTLSIQASVNPFSGQAPLNGVDVAMTVLGTATGTINYKIDCQDNGSWEKEVSLDDVSYTAVDLCDYPSAGVYSVKITVERENLAYETTLPISVSQSSTTPPVVPPTPPSPPGGGGGSGGGGGGGGSFPQPVLSISKTVSDSNKGDSFEESISVGPVELISFQIKISVQNQNIFGVFVKDVLPEGLIYMGNLKIDGVPSNADITDKLQISSLLMGQTRTITFDAGTVNEDKFAYGENKLINTAMIYQDNIVATDAAEVIVVKKKVLGATSIATGLTNNIFFDSFFLPLMLTIAIIWLLKSRVIKYEEWLDLRKEQYQIYRGKKDLWLKIAKIKTKEFFSKKAV